jgi:Flp pilus assembly protein TadD
MDLRLRVGRTLLADDVRGIRIDAASRLADFPREGLSAEDAAAIDRGVAEYVEAQRSNADRAEAHANLGVITLARGDLAAAEAAFRRALAMRPSFHGAAVNLADVLRLGGRDDEGERVLRDALGRAVEKADVHHALGLLLVRRRRIDEALEHLRKAADLRPSDGRAAYVLAVALHDTGERGAAMDVLLAAQARRPADRGILGALAAYSQEAGDRGAALRWARLLAEESLGAPEARRLVESLEQGGIRR